jgi:hypothetical protein
MKPLLIVANIPSENTRLLRDAAQSGAESTTCPTVVREPLAANPEDVINCAGIIIGTTENFGYMSGLIKDFFERIYYPCLEHTQALPMALYIKAGNDGEGTRISVERIVKGLQWRQVQQPLLLVGDYQPGFSEKCYELGECMAEGIKLGVF